MSENIVTANHKYAEHVGYDFGPASNEVQAALLNGFAHGLRVACGSGLGMQIAYMSDHLSAEAREVIREIAASIEALA